MNDFTRPIHFLLIEDDPDHADLIARAMKENRVSNTMVHVDNGEAALSYLKKSCSDASILRPDVILLDINLPRMSGLELLHIIKQDETISSIPVVMLTTSQSEIDRHRAYAAHANSYVVKPMDFEQFHKLVLELGLYWAMWNVPPPAGTTPAMK